MRINDSGVRVSGHILYFDMTGLGLALGRGLVLREGHYQCADKRQ